MMHRLISKPEVVAMDGELNPVVAKVLLDITQFRDGIANIYIGDTLWYFDSDRMWQPSDGKEWVGKNIIRYNANGEYSGS